MGARYITLHWTAGTYRPTVSERGRYHYLISGDGKIVQGRFRISDNIPPLKDGLYAAHCGGGNSWNVGISLCGMAGYTSPRRPGQFPLKRAQFEAACRLTAQICKQERIPVEPSRVFTHQEFGLRNPGSSSFGKIDVSWIPWEPALKPNEVGDYFRNKVRWYLQRI